MAFNSSMPLRYGEFLGLIAGNSTEEAGACMYLMFHYWAWKMKGMPDDDRTFARVTKLHILRWKAIKPAVMRLFVLREDGWHFRYPAIWREEVRTRIPNELKQAVRDRDGNACRYCGDATGPFEFDHYIPFSRGGQTDLENLRLACVPCNRDKWDLMPDVWEAIRKGEAD